MLRQMLMYLRRGGVVGILGDRDVTHNGLPVTFFGAPTTLPIGPIRLAVETGAVLVTMFCPRHGDRYRLFVEEVPVQRTGDREQDMAWTAERVVAVLERIIRPWPEQWVIFERIWTGDRPQRLPRRPRALEARLACVSR
jgi:KDO2-lipid IV(A) lauroyltransferase